MVVVPANAEIEIIKRNAAKKLNQETTRPNAIIVLPVAEMAFLPNPRNRTNEEK